MKLSASNLWRAKLCVGSVVLPGIRTLHADAEAGTADHAEYEAECPPGERAEVAFALNIDTGEVRELHVALRAYPKILGRWLYGTCDRLKVEEDRVIIRDRKSGFGFMVTAARANLQLGFYAVCAARKYSRDSATVEVLIEGRKPDVAELDAIDLATIEAEIRNIWLTAWEQREVPDPDIQAGAHCWRCPAFARCPAKVTLALALAGGLEGRELPTLELTHEAVALGWTRLKQIKAVLGAVEAAYRGYAAETPVPLGGGRMLGSVEKARETVDGRVALAVLTDLIGPDLALGAVDLEASKASVQRAMKTADASRGLSGRVAKALDAIRAEGGVGVRRSSNVEEYAE